MRKKSLKLHILSTEKENLKYLSLIIVSLCYCFNLFYCIIIVFINFLYFQLQPKLKRAQKVNTRNSYLQLDTKVYIFASRKISEKWFSFDLFHISNSFHFYFRKELQEYKGVGMEKFQIKEVSEKYFLICFFWNKGMPE